MQILFWCAVVLSAAWGLEKLTWLLMSPAERERCRESEARVRVQMREERLAAIRLRHERDTADLRTSERLRRERSAEILRARETALRNTFFPRNTAGPRR